MASYRVTFTQPQLEMLLELVDSGVKRDGLKAARQAAMIQAKVEAAEKIEEDGQDADTS